MLLQIFDITQQEVFCFATEIIRLTSAVNIPNIIPPKTLLHTGSVQFFLIHLIIFDWFKFLVSCYIKLLPMAYIRNSSIVGLSYNNENKKGFLLVFFFEKNCTTQ